MLEPAEPSHSLRTACRVGFRHWRKMALFFVTVMSVVTAVAFLTPRAYRSQAKLFLRLGRENAILDPATTFGQAPVVAVPQSRENEINSIIEVLRSRALLEQVVDRVGPSVVLGEEDLPADFTPGPPPVEDAAEDQEPRATPAQPGRGSPQRDRAVRLLARQLDIEAIKKSNVIQITCDGASPEAARAIVATLTAFYLDRHLRLNRTPGGKKFLDEQTARMHASLTKTEEQLKELQRKLSLFSPDAQKQILVARVGRLEDELLQTDAALSSAESEVKSLRARLADLSPTQVVGRVTGVRNEAADLMRGQLYTLQLRELELLARHPPNHPDVKLVRQQVAAARELLAKEEKTREQVTAGPSRLYEETQLELTRRETALVAQRTRRASLDGQLVRERSALETLNANSLRLATLQREVDIQSARYRKYSDTLEQVHIDRALEAQRISNVTVVQPATFDALPVRPRRSLYLAAGLLIAVVGSLGLAWLAEYLGHSVKTPDDLEKRLGLPVLSA